MFPKTQSVVAIEIFLTQRRPGVELQAARLQYTQPAIPIPLPTAGPLLPGKMACPYRSLTGLLRYFRPEDMQQSPYKTADGGQYHPSKWSKG